jgi:two-component system response regulator YesN
MYKVFLVDDERIILDGISQIIEWESIGCTLMGTARNGISAFQEIEEARPDIVISDIKMPGMDGLELVAKVHAFDPTIKFIMLSGFNEFEYAQTAMKYGVKHYLLKPCNELKIMSALSEVIEVIVQDETQAHFIDNMKQGLQKVLPHVKSQLLKEFVTNKTYGKRDWEAYRKLIDFEFEDRKVRLILIQLEGKFDFEHMFAVKNIAEEVLGIPVLSTTIGEHVLILLEDITSVELIQSKLETIRGTFLQYYKMDLTVALSDTDCISKARKLYKETLECLSHRFYLGEGSLIMKRDITLASDVQNSKDFTFDEEQFCMHVKTGRSEAVATDLNEFFLNLAEQRLDIHTTKSYVIQLFLSAIRLCDADRMDTYMRRISDLMVMSTLSALKDFMDSAIEEITMHFYELNKDKHYAIVEQVKEIIQYNLSSSELSLNWVASEVLYMNADYLGKLFKKETGEKFTNYLTRLRVDRAIELLQLNSDIKIFELADQIGFGDNPQYFSQVFKKQTGCTPSEYKREA